MSESTGSAGGAAASAREALATAVARLADAGARDELLVERIVPKPVLGVRRGDRLRPVGRVWRLGVLLLGDDGSLHAMGELVRAGDPGHSALQSALATERRELRVMARRAGIADGETVNVGARPLDLDAPTDPLVAGERDGLPVLLVRWTPHSASDPIPLAAYLDERVGLLVDPPLGST